MDYDKSFIDQVQHAIEATEPEIETKSDEAILVRTADAYSHFTSVHFFAKSNYSPDFIGFLGWFGRKIDSTFQKLAIEELKEEVRPTYDWYKRMLKIHQTESEKNFLEEVVG